MSLVNSSSAALQGLRHHAPVQAPMQAYVIEVGDTQAGLVSRAPEERFFTFISASSAFHRLEGHRFATPLAAEQAARLLAASQRGKRYQL